MLLRGFGITLAIECALMAVPTDFSTCSKETWLCKGKILYDE